MAGKTKRDLLEESKLDIELKNLNNKEITSIVYELSLIACQAIVKESLPGCEPRYESLYDEREREFIKQKVMQLVNKIN